MRSYLGSLCRRTALPNLQHCSLQLQEPDPELKMTGEAPALKSQSRAADKDVQMTAVFRSFSKSSVCTGGSALSRGLRESLLWK